MDPTFSRLQVLVGTDGLERLGAAKVLLLGVGGVGSWAAEALIRNGIGHLTMVDSDLVCVTNVNRQLQATYKTVGQSKVQALRDRLLDVYPRADVVARNEVYDAETAGSYNLNDYDYVIDAIDSLTSKVLLIKRALEADTVFYSAMGAACKLDATRIKVGSFWRISGCPLARTVRRRLRKQGVWGDFTTVYSDENLPQFNPVVACGSGNCACPGMDEDGGRAHEWCSAKKRINGSSVHVTGIYGFHLAALVTNHILQTPIHAD